MLNYSKKIVLVLCLLGCETPRQPVATPPRWVSFEDSDGRLYYITDPADFQISGRTVVVLKGSNRYSVEASKVSYGW